MDRESTRRLLELLSRLEQALYALSHTFPDVPDWYFGSRYNLFHLSQKIQRQLYERDDVDPFDVQDLFARLPLLIYNTVDRDFPWHHFLRDDRRSQMLLQALQLERYAFYSEREALGEIQRGFDRLADEILYVFRNAERRGRDETTKRSAQPTFQGVDRSPEMQSVRKPKREASETRKPPPVRIVNTGFNSEGTIDSDAVPASPLDLQHRYWFWVSIGELQSTSIEEIPWTLPETIPENAELTVVVFSFPGELQLDPSADQGTMRLTGSGAAEVVHQPTASTEEIRDTQLRKERLFFPVVTPASPGAYRLRCNIYYEHVLVQARVVTAYCGQRPERGNALRATLDYKLSHLLDPSHLRRLGPQELSIFVNRNNDGSHGFFFEGKQDFRASAQLDANGLQDLITQARKTLRRISWGTDQQWKSSDPYRYATRAGKEQFQTDLVQLAIRGYLLYHALIDAISGSPDLTEKLAEIMRSPGRVQIAGKESARTVVPAALFYDHPLDTQKDNLTICDTFIASLETAHSYTTSECMEGRCPNYGKLEVICPSGFWGYRHELGFPVSVNQARAGDISPDIPFADPASLAIVVSLDNRLIGREAHVKNLGTVRTPLTVLHFESKKLCLAALRNAPPHIAYFYCHGGVNENNLPYLSIGPAEYVTPDNIRAYGIRWRRLHPLVFLNGCMTTALEPEKALEFVSSFVGYASAAGVIGTEITVFEPLATKFAESFFHDFLGNCRSLGTAVRNARLSLLAERNPLGLLYIPFALAGLHMTMTGAQNTPTDSELAVARVTTFESPTGNTAEKVIVPFTGPANPEGSQVRLDSPSTTTNRPAAEDRSFLARVGGAIRRLVGQSGTR